MNSYPAEFLVQLRPVMFIAGLDIPQEPSSSDPEMSEDDRILIKSLQDDPFVSLMKRLRETLQEKSIKKGKIWLEKSERGQTGYRMIMVDKNVRFPPQKATSQDSHSPLSPLTKISPLYPDGIMAPVWLRKHTELLPSLFVLFLRLFEYSGMPVIPISPLHGQNEKDDEKRKEEERKHDIELSAEIAVRKRACSERGIKLTVVLMASRKLLDDPTLDSRLTLIRRQSSLDSRAALFVLSPINTAELQDFVQSLQSALHESALEYYNNHSKRVRRKRNKQVGSLGTTSVNYSSLTTPVTIARPVQPLRPQGWLTRYEYKMGCFAEFRGEEEVARKHFQTAWEILVDMFGSIGVLPPRTKRWAEAKVLADSISVKIIKLYLCREEHSLAMAHFNAHLTRFADLNRIWGIGEDTWEFWSWIARWYKILAELVELAFTHNTKIPIHFPAVPTSAIPETMEQIAVVQQAEQTQLLGVKPSNVLQHPGFYYYLAAICTQRRLEKFVAANKEVTESEAVTVPTYLANERKVDHMVIILELFTKAYDWFKKNSSTLGQSRFTFYLACRIAETYAESGKEETAIKFFEKIAKPYRRERWKTLLWPTLHSWYACCRKTGNAEAAVKILVEMLCHDSCTGDEAAALNEDLNMLLSSSSPNTIPLQVDLTDYTSKFKESMVFWKSEVTLLEHAPFQLHLCLPSNLAALSCSRLSFKLNDDACNIVINHKHSNTANMSKIEHINLDLLVERSTHVAIDANLQHASGGKIIVSGTIMSNLASSLKFTNITTTFCKDDWMIDLMLSTTAVNYLPTEWLYQTQPPGLLSLQRSSPTIAIRPKQHRIQTTFSHLSPTYLDEENTITISVANIDEHPLEVVVDVLLYPAENETINRITLNDASSNSLIKGVSFGTLKPAQICRKTLLLHSTGVCGDRFLDISVQYDLPNEKEKTTPLLTSPMTPTSTNESLYSLTIPTVNPFNLESSVVHRHLFGYSMLEISDLRRYDPFYLEPCIEIFLQTTITTAGPWPIRVHGIALMAEENDTIKLSNSSLGVADDFPLDFEPGDVYSMSCQFKLLAREPFQRVEVPSLGTVHVKWSRSKLVQESSSTITTRLSLPGLSMPESGIQASLEMPIQGTLHVPFTASLHIRNNHPWQTADIHLQLEPSEFFVVSGLRSGNLPILLAGNEDRILFNLVPMVSGTVQLPIFKLFDRRKTKKMDAEAEAKLPLYEESVISVLDGRIQEKDGEGKEIRLKIAGRDLQNIDPSSTDIFILPS